MESLDFVLVVVPLTIIVATLTGLIYYLARREEFNKHKRAIIIQKFLGIRSKQQALMRQESEKLTTLYESGSIDKNTYERLQNVLFMTQEKLRYEASILLDKKDGVFKKIKELSVEKVLLEPEQDGSLEPETIRGEQEVCEVTPKKRESVKPQMKLKAKRKRVRELQAGKKKEVQMGLVVEGNALLRPNEKDQPVSQ
jgi:uncharacterized protein YqgQ